MKLEASKKQLELLNYISFSGVGSAPIEHWMNSATIASLIRRDAIGVQVLKRSVKLIIKPQGYFMLEYQPTNYYDKLREVSKWRHR
jgi:hypothetical protein